MANSIERTKTLQFCLMQDRFFRTQYQNEDSIQVPFMRLSDPASLYLFKSPLQKTQEEFLN